MVSLGLGAGVGIYLKSDPPEREPAVWARRPPGEQRRVLVVANETLPGRSLRDEIQSRAGPGAAEVLLVAPALDSSAPHWGAEEDARRAEASGRLDEAVASLVAAGVEAHGAVGDADPLQAIDHALRTFAADEVLIATRPHGKSDWLDRDVVASARERFPVPVAHVVVDLDTSGPGRESRELLASGRLHDVVRDRLDLLLGELVSEGRHRPCPVRHVLDHRSRAGFDSSRFGPIVPVDPASFKRVTAPTAVRREEGLPVRSL